MSNRFEFVLIMVLIWIYVFLQPVATGQANLKNAEDGLFTKLFKENGYDSRVRPAQNSSQPVNVSFRYDLVQLYEVNERSQTVCILSQVYQVWRDYRLYWNSSDFDNLKLLAISSQMIWTPDTTLANTVEVYRPNTEDIQKALVINDPENQTATVSYFYNTRHTVGCLMDMRYFPFDTHNCTFTFASWVHDMTMINYELTTDVVTREIYQPSDVWALISFNITTDQFQYECCVHPFSMIHANMVIRRKSLYYTFNIIIPTILINILSSFSLFASQGTPENMHDKLQIGITTVLAYCILLMSVSDQLPKGSTSVPLLGIFYIIVMVQNTVELFIAISLCDPVCRRKLASLCAKIYQRKIKPNPNEHHFGSNNQRARLEKSAKDTNDMYGRVITEDRSDFLGDRWQLEHLCMIGSIIFTILTAVALFAIGLSH